jgi:propanol-preferring alcohol dehydrogenase
MKAAVLTAIGSPLTIEDVPIPQVGPGEVLIETHTCGICRTDLHIQDGLAYVPHLPHIPGHEPAGTVAQLGPGVTTVRPGQRVIPHLFVRSADCRYTRAGEHAQALHLRGIIGVTLPGGFAEYITAPAQNLIPLPDAVPFDVGGLTCCAVITAVHAWRKAGVREDETAVVLGAGGIGLILIQLLRAAGVRVMAVDRGEQRCAQAVQAGAELAVPIEDAALLSRVRDFARPQGGDGVDCVFELVGSSATMRAAANLARRGGRIIVIGEEAEFPAIDTIGIAQRELQIFGSRNGNMQDAVDALDLIARGVVRPPVAATFPLEQINEALDVVRNHKAQGRVIVRTRG